MNAINVQMFAMWEANPPELIPEATVVMYGGFIPAKAADWINPANGALWIFNGAEDQVVWPEHAVDLEAAWSAEGLPHRVHLIPGLAHVGVDMLDPDSGPEPGMSWFDDMAEFLYQELYE
ncbi:MAG: hypothetical protein HKN26_14910 [Acidimicrobiales bacterium]|nr:hypothetical protein [Acidimicrobiales bacterium]